MSNRQDNPVYIYVILAPGSDPYLPDTWLGNVRYVGRTSCLNRRWNDHRGGKGQPSARTCWIHTLLAKGLEPVFAVVEICSEADWRDRERHWQEYFLAQGEQLLNMAECGSGAVYSQLVHGMTGTREWRIWHGILTSCGAWEKKRKGCKIKVPMDVYPEWGDFRRFLADMGPIPSENHVLSRTDKTRGFFPDNCQWATRVESFVTASKTRAITIDGISKSIRQWADEIGVCHHTIVLRLESGWDPKIAVTTAVNPHWRSRKQSDAERTKRSASLKGHPTSEETRKRISDAAKARTAARCGLTVGGVTKTHAEWGSQIGLSATTVKDRLRRGWDPERAVTMPAIAPKGRPMSAETREKISDASRGKPKSAETRAKMTEAMYRRWAAKEAANVPERPGPPTAPPRVPPLRHGCSESPGAHGGDRTPEVACGEAP